MLLQKALSSQSSCCNVPGLLSLSLGHTHTRAHTHTSNTKVAPGPSLLYYLGTLQEMESYRGRMPPYAPPPRRCWSEVFPANSGRQGHFSRSHTAQFHKASQTASAVAHVKRCQDGIQFLEGLPVKLCVSCDFGNLASVSAKWE